MPGICVCDVEMYTLEMCVISKQNSSTSASEQVPGFQDKALDIFDPEPSHPTRRSPWEYNCAHTWPSLPALNSGRMKSALCWAQAEWEKSIEPSILSSAVPSPSKSCQMPLLETLNAWGALGVKLKSWHR